MGKRDKTEIKKAFVEFIKIIIWNIEVHIDRHFSYAKVMFFV